MASTTFREALQRVTADDLLVLLRIECPSFTGPFLLANDTRPWESQGVTYVGYPFTFQPPDDKDGENARATLTMDNIGKDMMAELEARPPLTSVMATIAIAAKATPNMHELTFVLPLTVAKVTPTTITATVGDDEEMNRSAVLMRFNPWTTPGLF